MESCIAVVIIAAFVWFVVHLATNKSANSKRSTYRPPSSTSRTQSRPESRRPPARSSRRAKPAPKQRKPSIRGIEIEPPDRLGDLKLRVRASREYTDGMGQVVELRGRMPEPSYGMFGIVSSMFDCTHSQLYPILSSFDKLQEPETHAYHCRKPAFELDTGDRLKWSPIAPFIPLALIGPYTGFRSLRIVVRIIDIARLVLLDEAFEFNHGRVTSGLSAVKWTGTVDVKQVHIESGYLDQETRRRRFHELGIQAAAAIAMSDGEVDPEETQVMREQIEKWTRNVNSVYKAIGMPSRTAEYGQVAAKAIEQAQAGILRTAPILDALAKTKDKALAHEVVQLCFDVTVADGVADAGELRLIERVAKACGLDMKEVERLRDSKIIGLDPHTRVEATVEELLGIDAGWDNARICKHLASEFHKWNSRLNTVPEGAARKNAQRMLDLIADARKKYK